MSMNNAEQFLVIVLSAALAIFLVLGIMVLIKVNQILKHLRYITEKAEHIADKAEAVTEFFQKTAGTTAITNLISNIVSSFKQHKTNKGDDDER